MRPRISDERTYFRDINSLVNELHNQTVERVQNAGETEAAWVEAVNASFAPVQTYKPYGLKQATDNMTRVKEYHTAAFAKKAQAAIGIDVTPLLSNMMVNLSLADRIAQNVSLIKSIPTELHPQVIQQIQNVFATDGFNNDGLLQVIKQRFSVASSRAKVIARDQTSKAIGQFTQIRQQQLGINKYEWIGVGDEAERDSHVANNGLIFSWDNPPPETGHPGDDINCRCVAGAVLDFEEDEG